MLLKYFVAFLAIAPLLNLQAQISQPASDHKIQAQDVTITGTRTIDSIELDEIASALTAKPINEDEHEIKDRLRFAFADHGYLKPEIESVRVKAIDALAHPKLVAIEAVVSEGQRYKMGEVSFKGNHAFNLEQLKAEFPLHQGELFNRSKIGRGLDSLRILYSKQGYLDVIGVPNTKVSTDSVDLDIDIDEGPQYRMGSLEFGGNTNVADRLRSRWELEANQPFDQTYIQKFVDENHSLFPVTFDLQSSLKIGRDCKNSSIDVLIDLDPEHPVKPPQDVPCESKKSNPETN